MKIDGEHTSKKVTGLASSRQNFAKSVHAISGTIRLIHHSLASTACRRIIVIPGHESKSGAYQWPYTAVPAAAYWLAARAIIAS